MAKLISHSSLGMRTIIFTWLAIFVVSSYTIIDGRHISREDYLEAKRVVKLSRRPSVKIIQAENGDIFDCVIIDKQLAFEHPALKNHTIRMKPNFVPEWQKDEGSNRTRLSMGLKGGGCPLGSVPNQRLQISDILRSTSVSTFGRKDTTSERLYAMAISRGEFSGARAFSSIWNPNVVEDQFSLSQVWIVNDLPYEPKETIEAGWIVNPAKFFDHQTRFFIYWTTDGYRSNGCYNTECEGFMLLSQTFQPGHSFREVSSYDGREPTVSIRVEKDEDGDWVLYVYGDLIGYWPNTLFHRLSTSGSNRVSWGGEVYNTRPRDLPWPPMGSGHFPDRDNIRGRSCYFSNMRVFRGDEWEASGDFLLVESKPNCYKIIDGGNIPTWGRNIAFGGPGGQC